MNVWARRSDPAAGTCSAVGVVTGGGCGLGRSIALSLASRGAAVVVVDIDGEAVDAVAQEIRTAGGLAVGLAIDVLQPDQAQELAELTLDLYGAPDVLVTAPGPADGSSAAAVIRAFLPTTSSAECGWASSQQTIRVNA
jgi:NAD(P)-dependent dehydrogenase (short-subunit alcohol dehydrogenase family)